MKLPQIRSWQDVQFAFDFLSSHVVGLLFGPAGVQQQVFTVTFTAVPVGNNAFGFTLPKAFPRSFIGAHATFVTGSVGGTPAISYVLPSGSSGGSIFINNTNVQNLTVLFTAYGT
jgi:hypothetical protein